jgi:hypothetical protein
VDTYRVFTKFIQSFKRPYFQHYKDMKEKPASEIWCTRKYCNLSFFSYILSLISEILQGCKGVNLAALPGMHIHTAKGATFSGNVNSSEI